MTIEELAQKLEELQAKYDQLEYDYMRLREWSDDNDYWLREMIDALTESVDGIVDDHCGCKRYQKSRSERTAKKWQDYKVCHCEENGEGI